MTAFSNISKVVGFEKRTVAIPTVTNAKILLKMVRERHCRESFRRVLELHRFAPAAKTNDETAAMKIVFEAYEKGHDILTRYMQ